MLVDDLVHQVAQVITRYSMLTPGERLGVAVSGGADSLVLLHILHTLSERLNIALTVLHVNHELRGPESDADESFVRRIAEQYQLPILVKRGTVPKGNLEQEARQVRREFFREAMQMNNLHRVALGHTRTDQAETVLFRLLRGSGPTGLGGMPFISKSGLIRPLLKTSREAVRHFAEAANITWRDDSSNKDIRFARNRLRLQTIPQLTRDFNPNLELVLSGTAEIAREEEFYWQRKADHVFRSISRKAQGGIVIELTPLKNLSLALQRRTIRHAVSRVRGQLRAVTLAHIDSILAITRSSHGHDRVIIPGLDALRSFNCLLLCPPETLKGERGYLLDIQEGMSYHLPFGSTLR